MAREGNIEIGLVLETDTGDSKQELGSLVDKLDDLVGQMDQLEDAADGAGGGLEDAAKDARTFGNSLRDARKSARTFGKSVSSALGNIRKGVEIARRAFEVLKIALRATVGAALEFREAGDPMVKTLTDAQRSAKLLGARLGDAVLPALVGVAKAFSPMVKAAQEYLKANNKIIASEIVESLVDVGRVILDVLAPALVIGNKAIVGLGLAFDALKVIAGLVMGEIANLVKLGVQQIADIADDLGIENSFTRELQGVTENLDAMVKDFSKQTDATVAEMERNVAEMEKFEATIDAAKAAADEFLNGVLVAGMKAAADATSGTNKTLEEQAAALDALRKAQADSAAALAEEEQTAAALRAEAIAVDKLEQEESLRLKLAIAEELALVREMETQAIIDANETRFQSDLAAFDKRKELAENTAKAQVQLLGEVRDAFQSNLSAALIDGITGAKSFAAAFSQMADAVVADLVRIGVQKALTGIFDLVFGGGTGLAGGLLGTLLGVATGAHGGLVTGGTRGRDTVPALLGQGEIVLPPDIADVFRGIREGGGGAMGGGAPVFNLTIINNSVLPPDVDRMERQINETITPVIQRALQMGG